jgi:hypothetical protein
MVFLKMKFYAKKSKQHFTEGTQQQGLGSRKGEEVNK